MESGKVGRESTTELVLRHMVTAKNARRVPFGG